MIYQSQVIYKTYLLNIFLETYSIHILTLDLTHQELMHALHTSLDERKKKEDDKKLKNQLLLEKIVAYIYLKNKPFVYYYEKN